MLPLIIVLRAVHIMLGVFWAGTVLFLNTLLLPSVVAAGPAGGQVMYQLGRHRFHNVMGITSTLTVLSGATLLWLASAGFSLSWVESPVGATFCLGGAAAIASYLMGLLKVRPRVQHIERLQGELNQATTESLRAAHLGRMAQLRAEMTTWARWTAVLLLVAVGAMATARYV